MRKLILIMIGVVLIALCGCEEQSIGSFPDMQKSEHRWTAEDGDFISGMCEKYGINASKDYYRISCPKCIVDGCVFSRLPDGSVVGNLFTNYCVEPVEIGCSKCGYPLAHDWNIYKIYADYNSYETRDITGSIECAIGPTIPEGGAL